MNTRWLRKNQLLSQNFWAILLVVALGVVTLRPHLVDWLNVAPPSPEVERLALVTTMTPEAQQIFYRQDPAIVPKSAFAEICQPVRKTSDSLILFGCYLSKGKSGKIAVQKVSDPRFQGIMEVAAAHEMLHAVYTRLSPSQRSTLTPQLEKAAQRVQEPRLAAVLKRYQATDTALYINELHSYLGTELGDLGNAELEQYYQRYFRNRHQVVALSHQSQSALRKLDDKAKRLKTEIDTLETNLKQTQQALKESEQNLESEQQSLDVLNSELLSLKEQAEQSYRQGVGSSTLVSQFEQKRFDYNERVGSHNSQVRQHLEQVDLFKGQVAQYKQKVSTYNEIAQEERSLFADLTVTPSSKRKDTSDDLSRPLGLNDRDRPPTPAK
jgi:uncharacterized coiled-coil DUF342 family protein